MVGDDAIELHFRTGAHRRGISPDACSKQTLSFVEGGCFFKHAGKLPAMLVHARAVATARGNGPSGIEWK
jgi:hypothetical protein